MGKKYYGDLLPVTRSEWLQHTSNREFQQEWFPFCKNTMRQAWKIRFKAHWFEDCYGWGRYPHRRDDRCWKKHRKQQWKVCTSSTKSQSINEPSVP